MSTGSLHNMAMLASLKISVYSGRKMDKKATQELASWHGITEAGAVKAGKRLLPEDAESFAKITAAVSKGRLEFYRQTLPWDDTGSRILPAANFLPMTSAMREIEGEFYQALPEFYEEWPLLKARSKKILNGLYREEDYPTMEKLKKRFSFEIKFYPLPDSADFRAELRQEDVDAIRAQIDLDTKATVQRSMEEPYRRLFDGVAHMASRLQGQTTCLCRACKGKTFSTDQFGDSIVENLVSLCDILPRLNLTGDPELSYLIDQVKASLTPFEPDAIRSSEALKSTLAERAQEIQEQMSAFMAPAA